MQVKYSYTFCFARVLQVYGLYCIVIFKMVATINVRGFCTQHVEDGNRPKINPTPMECDGFVPYQRDHVLKYFDHGSLDEARISTTHS